MNLTPTLHNRMIILSVFAASIATWANAADIDSLKTGKRQITITYFDGYLWAHHSKMEAMYRHNLSGIEIDYALQTNGSSNWESFYNYPEYGIAALYYDLGNRQYLGSAYAVQPYIAFPFLSPHSWGNIFFKGSVGIGYVTKPWERTSNYKNVGIGSHFNAAAKFEIVSNFTIGRDWKLSLGIAFSHISNGSTNNPNAGINMPNFNIGTSYTYGPKYSYIKYQRLDYEREIQYTIFPSISYKDVFPDGVGHYFVYTLSNEFLKPVSLHSGITANLDLILDESHRALLRLRGKDVSSLEMVRTGITIGYLLRFNRFSTSYQMGSNIYSYYKTAGSIYQRLGLRYNVYKRLYAHVALRTNWFNADCIEMGFGYKFVMR